MTAKTGKVCGVNWAEFTQYTYYRTSDVGLDMFRRKLKTFFV